jgi:hypothetical protein
MVYLYIYVCMCVSVYMLISTITMIEIYKSYNQIDILVVVLVYC